MLALSHSILLLLLLVAVGVSRNQLVAGKSTPVRHGSRMAPLAPPREILVHAEPLNKSATSEPATTASAPTSSSSSSSTTTTTTTTTTSTARPQTSKQEARYGPSAGSHFQLGDIEAAGSNINEIMAPTQSGALTSSASRRQVLLAPAPLPTRGQPRASASQLMREPADAADASDEADERDEQANSNLDEANETHPAESRRSGGAGNQLTAAPTSSSKSHRRQEDEEALARREQEAAEASEAELADRSALDEQRQAQREIILAQAQSEAKAIREQQESLLKQQLLQQQMISRRHNQLEANRTARNGARRTRPSANSNMQATTTRSYQRYSSFRPMPVATNQVEERRQVVVVSKAEKSRHSPLIDSQFSDQSDGVHQQPAGEAGEDLSLLQAPSDRQEVYDYSLRRPASPSKADASQDLQTAAQHLYGAHYDTLGAHRQSNKNYFQFAESYKGGQFHSGYKRGGKRLQISGHSSQHKDHAEGHIKWRGKKGKGSSYWDYQHGPHSNGGKHHYYSF